MYRVDHDGTEICWKPFDKNGNKEQGMSILTMETRQTEDSLNHSGGESLKQRGYSKANGHNRE